MSGFVDSIHDFSIVSYLFDDMTLVLYYFQNCLGESADTPNAFYLPPGEATFGFFLTHFPVKDSNLHFRVKCSDPTHGYIWKDLFSRSEVLPLYQDAIFLKILRHDRALIEKQLRVLSIQKSLEARGVSSGPKPSFESQKTAPTPKKPATPVNSSSSGGSAVQSPSAATPAAPAATAGAASSSATATASTSPPPASSSGADVSSPGPSLTRQPSVDMLDFGSSAGGSVKSPASAVPSSFANVSSAALDIDTSAGPKMTRDELAQRRMDSVDEKVQIALDFKKELDDKLAREAVELDAAKEKHEKALTAWAMANNKEKRNVRTLLSTVHTVLWKDSAWKPLSLADVIEAKKVKLHYRKAMLVVHPDKCSNMDSETKFIAKRIFEAINEAYDEFLKKENV